MIRRRLLFLIYLFSIPTIVRADNWIAPCSSGLEYLLSFAMTGFAFKGILYNYEDLLDASPEATAFVQEQLRFQNVQSYEKIKVKVGINYGAVRNVGIVLMAKEDNPTRSFLDDVLDESRHGETPEIRQSAEYYLDIFKVIIHHEIQHLVHNDEKTLFLGKLGIPVLTYAGTRLAEEGIKKILPDFLTPGQTSATTKNGFKIFKGVARYLMNSLLYVKLSRYLEQRADNGIPSDRKMLKAFREYLYSVNDQLREQIKNNDGERAAEFFDTNRLYYELKNFVMDREHPSPLTRIKRVDERLATLDEAS